MKSNPDVSNSKKRKSKHVFTTTGESIDSNNSNKTNYSNFSNISAMDRLMQGDYNRRINYLKSKRSASHRGNNFTKLSVSFPFVSGMVSGYDNE